MGRPSNAEKYLTPQWLECIKDWSKQGATQPQIAEKLGIGSRTLDRWIEKYPELKEALEIGKANQTAIAIGSLMKLIQGYDEEEVTIERYKLNGKYIEDNEKYPVKEVRKKRHVAPNASAVFFYLKTQCGWRETNHVEVSARPINPLEGLTTEELRKLAYSKQVEEAEVIEVKVNGELTTTD